MEEKQRRCVACVCEGVTQTPLAFWHKIDTLSSCFSDSFLFAARLTGPDVKSPLKRQHVCSRSLGVMNETDLFILFCLDCGWLRICARWDGHYLDMRTQRTSCAQESQDTLWDSRAVVMLSSPGNITFTPELSDFPKLLCIMSQRIE